MHLAQVCAVPAELHALTPTEVPSNQGIGPGVFKSVPVTLITGTARYLCHQGECYQARLNFTCNAGFLGAGKTTLVHHILKASHKHRIAVIVNEFGDTSGIERAAVTSGQVSWLPYSMGGTCEGNTMTVGVVLQARYCCGAVCI